jgi:hypothetical protein
MQSSSKSYTLAGSPWDGWFVAGLEVWNLIFSIFDVFGLEMT